MLQDTKPTTPKEGAMRPEEYATVTLPLLPREIWALILSHAGRCMIPFMRTVCSSWRHHLARIELPHDNRRVPAKNVLATNLIRALAEEGYSNLLPLLPSIGVQDLRLDHSQRDIILRKAIHNGDLSTFEHVLALPSVHDDDYLSYPSKRWNVIFRCLESTVDTTAMMRLVVVKSLTLPLGTPPASPSAVPFISNLVWLANEVPDMRAHLSRSGSHFRDYLIAVVLRRNPTLELFMMLQGAHPFDAIQLYDLMQSCARKDLVHMAKHVAPLCMEVGAMLRMPPSNPPLARSPEIRNVLRDVRWERCTEYTCRDVYEIMKGCPPIDVVKEICLNHQITYFDIQSTWVVGLGGRADHDAQSLIATMEALEEHNSLCACHRVSILADLLRYLDCIPYWTLHDVGQFWDMVVKMWEASGGDRVHPARILTHGLILAALLRDNRYVATWVLLNGKQGLATWPSARELIGHVSNCTSPSESVLEWVMFEMVDHINEPMSKDMIWTMLALPVWYNNAYSKGNLWVCRWLVTNLDGFTEWYERGAFNTVYGREQRSVQ